MGRIRQNIDIKDSKFWTLFDSGAKNTYIISKRAGRLHKQELKGTRMVALGGKDHSLTKWCLLEAKIEGKSIETDAYIIDSIGKDEDGNEIEILFGALAMQKWGIRLHLEEEKIDMSHYPIEFVEF
jgi:hypothetical protein